MANKNKTSWSVSCTPKILIDNTDTHVNMLNNTEVIHEDVRKSLGGSGEITGNAVVFKSVATRRILGEHLRRRIDCLSN